MKIGADHSFPEIHKAEKAINTAASVWQEWETRQQLVTLNILYLHNRTDTYEMEWERFQAEYQIFDAVFALARDTNKNISKQKYSHSDRLKALCDHYGIAADENRFSTIVRLRNDLIHEVIWDNRMPGEARSSESFYASYWLHKYTRRALLAVLGLKGPYVHYPWWSKDRCSFDIEP
ncbi:MAG: hypothetical protein HGA78_00400 [Nitrospirales bacterium]|nr:hypothetical protein [Nitrospirales bacterium]